MQIPGYKPHNENSQNCSYIFIFVRGDQTVARVALGFADGENLLILVITPSLTGILLKIKPHISLKVYSRICKISSDMRRHFPAFLLAGMSGLVTWGSHGSLPEIADYNPSGTV